MYCVMRFFAIRCAFGRVRPASRSRVAKAYVR